MSSRRKPTTWMDRLSAPVRLLIKERVERDGFAGDEDGWIADILTTARHSPQGYVLRLSAIKPKQARELAEAALEDAALFAQGGAE